MFNIIRERARCARAESCKLTYDGKRTRLKCNAHAAFTGRVRAVYTAGSVCTRFNYFPRLMSRRDILEEAIRSFSRGRAPLSLEDASFLHFQNSPSSLACERSSFYPHWPVCLSRQVLLSKTNIKRAFRKLNETTRDDDGIYFYLNERERERERESEFARLSIRSGR